MYSTLLIWRTYLSLLCSATVVSGVPVHGGAINTIAFPWGLIPALGGASGRGGNPQ